MPKKINIDDEIGKKYGRLTVHGDAGRDSRNRPMVTAVCDCGKTVVADLIYMRFGDKKSCGCLSEEIIQERNFRHGLTKTPLYKIWKGIKNRCSNKNSDDFKDYGGRGISVSSEWLNNPQAFVDYCNSMGWEPGLEIDRIDNDGNYEPGNVRFVKNISNANNKKLRRSDNKTGFRGVYQKGDTFVASLNFKGLIKKNFYGFNSAVEAAKFRDKKCVELGLITTMNFPREEVASWL